MRILLPQLFIMLLALGISFLPAFCFADTPDAGKETELICSQTGSEMEFIPVNLEGEIPLSNARPCLLPTLQHTTVLLPVNAATYRIIFCKKACFAGQVCACLPLRL